MAVLDTEPHISSLMDDLETIQQEKERLLEQNSHIERRWDDAVAKAARERSEHHERQDQLEGQLKKLEAGIKIKQQCITDLVHKEKLAQEAKETQTRKARELEERAMELTRQLEDLSSRNRIVELSEREAVEERKKRVALQEQLAETDKLTRRLERQLNKNREEEKARKEEESRTRDMLTELSSLRDAHAKLQLEFDGNQGRHRKDLDGLTAQVATFKRAKSDSMENIKRLEAKNADLTARLARSAKQLKQRTMSVRATASSGGGGGGEGYDDSTVTSVFSSSARSETTSQGKGVAFGSGTNRSGASVRGQSKHQQQPQQPPLEEDREGEREGEREGSMAVEEARRKSSLLVTWLLGRLDDITQARLASTELKRLTEKVDELERDHAAGMAEYKSLVTQQQEGEARLRGTLRDIDVKLHRMGDIQGNARQDGVKYKELEAQKQALLDHRSEVQARLAKGVLHRDKIHTMHDIAEELETITAEMDLNRVRLEEERRKVLKGPGGGGGGRGDNINTNTESGVEAVALAREMGERASSSSHCRLLRPGSAAILSARYARSRGEIQAVPGSE